jgi:hypothetical protein
MPEIKSTISVFMSRVDFVHRKHSLNEMNCLAESNLIISLVSLLNETYTA